MSAAKLLSSCRIRSTPYTRKVEALGVSGYSVVNHTILPKGFDRSVEEDYWHLREHVQLWDVGCQRQVELTGPDAARLAQMMTPRDLSSAESGQCLYAPMVDDKGGMLNDPVILKLGDSHFWFSIADADILLWAKGLAVGIGLEVQVEEPDVWPMAIQGPKSSDLMAAIFGNTVREIGFFRFRILPFDGHGMLVARSGYSKQGGFEIYLDNPDLAEPLWDALWQAGQKFNIAPGCPNLIERIEAGLLSYGNEMTRANNPFECGLDAYCQLDGSISFIGLEALRRIAETGPDRLIKGIFFDGDRCPACSKPWAAKSGNRSIGQITSAIWSPRFNTNIALGMIDKDHGTAGTEVQILCEDGSHRNGQISDLPMSVSSV